MTKVLTSVLLIFVCALLARPEVAHAAGVCDGLPEALSPVDLIRLGKSAKGVMPALYFDLVRDVPMVNADVQSSRGMIAPAQRNVPGNLKSVDIAIPLGFERRNCKLVQLSAALAANAFEWSSTQKRELADCIRQDRKKTDCLDEMLDRVVPLIEPAYGQNKDYSTQILYLANESFQFILEHELGHVVFLRGRKSIFGFEQVDEETGADLIASFTLLQDGKSIYPAALTLHGLSVLDSHVDWTGADHAPSECRLKNLLKLEDVAGIKARAMERSLIDVSEFKKIKDAIKPLGLHLPAVSGAVCSASSEREFEIIGADFDRIVASVDKAASENSGQAIRMSQDLLKPKLQSNFAKIYRSGIVAKWISNTLRQFIDDQDNISIGDFATMAHYQRARQIIVSLNALGLRQLESREVAVRDYPFYITQAMSFKEFLSGGNAQSAFANALSLLRKYAPDSASVPYYEGILMVLGGDCTGGLTKLRFANKKDEDVAKTINRLDITLDDDSDPDDDKESCRTLRYLAR